jgi:quercetin dioxygenase-like cupin family protein
MELIRAEAMVAFSKAGITSRQLLFPENSRSERITVTRVVVEPGAQNVPHRHATAEQIWIALRGAGELLLEHGQRRSFSAGDAVRFEDGELHGFDNNTGPSAFEYGSVTSPPLNFRGAYAKQ